MTPLLLLLIACFSDTTRHQGCDELKTADLKYYHVDHYGEDGKKYLESKVGQEVFIATTTIGYTLYKRELNYHFGSYGFKLTGSEGSASIKWSL